MTSPYSEGLVTALERAVDDHPEDADLHYALGMIQKRGTVSAGPRPTMKRPSSTGPTRPR